MRSGNSCAGKGAARLSAETHGKEAIAVAFWWDSREHVLRSGAPRKVSLGASDGQEGDETNARVFETLEEVLHSLDEGVRRQDVDDALRNQRNELKT